MSSSDLLVRLQGLNRLTNSETKIADYMFQYYPEVVFENVTSIAEKAGVSKASVVRFMQRLGYKNYAQFSKSVRKDVLEEFSSPEKRFRMIQKQLSEKGGDILSQNFSRILKNLQYTHQKIDLHHFEATARILANAERQLFITGVRTSFGLAYQMYTLLGYLRPNITLLDMQAEMLPNILADISSKAVLFAISFRPYARVTLRIAKYFSEKEAKVILLADSEFSPLSEFASTQFVVPSDGLGMFQSRCAATALLESLNIATMKYCGQFRKERPERMEKVFNEFEVYSPKSSVRLSNHEEDPEA